ncbi:MAG: hypothetical protein HY827_00210 [Actinobacteria bacterium]|nr:hypothetical protein [Actinomycetota bacterium]
MSFASSALLTGLSQSAVMIASGINAALIGARYPASHDTDGLFTAFAIYSIVVIISTSSRTAMVAHLMDDENRFRPFNEILVSLAWATLPLGVLFALIMPHFVGATVGTDAGSIAFKALLILWPAAVGQFVVALSAAMLGVLGDFRAAAAAFTAGGAATVVAFIGLEPPVGLLALPAAVLLGTVVTVAIVIAALWRRGWRPVNLSLSPGLAWRWQKTVTLGAAYYICAQGLYLISVSAAGHYVGEGAATLFAYAYFATGMALVMVSMAGSFVLAAGIAADWNGEAKTLIPFENDINRTQLLVAAAFTMATALIGADVAGAVLKEFSHRDVETIVDTMLALVPIVIASQWSAVPILALFAKKRLTTVALSGVAAVLLHVPISIALAGGGKLVHVAIAMSITNLLLAIVLLAIVHRGATAARLAQALAETLLIAIAAGASYLIANLTVGALHLGNSAQDFADFALASGLFLLVVWIALPQFRAIITRIAGSLLGDARRIRA